MSQVLVTTRQICDARMWGDIVGRDRILKTLKRAFSPTDYVPLTFLLDNLSFDTALYAFQYCTLSRDESNTHKRFRHLRADFAEHVTLGVSPMIDAWLDMERLASDGDAAAQRNIERYRLITYMQNTTYDLIDLRHLAGMARKAAFDETAEKLWQIERFRLVVGSEWTRDLHRYVSESSSKE